MPVKKEGVELPKVKVEHDDEQKTCSVADLVSASESCPEVVGAKGEMPVKEEQKPGPPARKRARCRNIHNASRLSAQPAPVRAALGPPFPLAKLPAGPLMLVFRKLSPADLTNAARLSRDLRDAADSEDLWRRHYFARWPAFVGRETHVMDAHFWKKAYMQRDAADYRSMLQGATGGPLSEQELSDYRALHTTRRNAVPRPEQQPAEEAYMRTTHEQARAYCRRMGFVREVPRPADLSRVAFTRFGDVFIDNTSGHVHVCSGTSCRERPDGVCTLTGRWHDPPSPGLGMEPVPLGQASVAAVWPHAAADDDDDEDTERLDPLMECFMGGWDGEMEDLRSLKRPKGPPEWAALMAAQQQACTNGGCTAAAAACASRRVVPRRGH